MQTHTVYSALDEGKRDGENEDGGCQGQVVCKGYGRQQACRGDISTNTGKKAESEPGGSWGDESAEQRQLGMTAWCVRGGLKVPGAHRVA